jgi:hypothetical protein
LDYIGVKPGHGQNLTMEFQVSQFLPSSLPFLNFLSGRATKQEIYKVVNFISQNILNVGKVNEKTKIQVTVEDL